MSAVIPLNAVLLDMSTVTLIPKLVTTDEMVISTEVVRGKEGPVQVVLVERRAVAITKLRRICAAGQLRVIGDCEEKILVEKPVPFCKYGNIK